MKGISIEMVQKMLAPLKCETFNQVWPHTCRSTPLYLSSYLGRTELSTALWVYKNYSKMPTKRNTASGSPGKLRFPLYNPFHYMGITKILIQFPDGLIFPDSQRLWNFIQHFPLCVYVFVKFSNYKNLNHSRANMFQLTQE